ncbi:hypothetical protein UFOVP1382_31 [uncultured Caudovirales phage]|uniref:Uncharacterized protein n=1 Tax=uncultured Caudovirales phage TaxID=2100421 RepID=A0A6J5S587_9CAUD|nr:hypothetical protein UFOVP1382_31 [uncultured Caudovirales phage]
MSRPDATPVTVTTDSSFGDGTIRESHPAFGMVSITHTQGRRHLFGSALESHQNYVVLRIKRAERNHSLGRDWFFAREQYIEIALSHAQYAAMISTPNTGDGVPCTIAWVKGEGMIPDFEPTETETAKVRATVEEKTRALEGALREARAEIEKLLEKSPAKTRNAVLGALDTASRKSVGGVPFYVESVREAVEKTVSHAKAEVESFITSAVHRIGLGEIAKRGEDALKLLSGPAEKHDDVEGS